MDEDYNAGYDDEYGNDMLAVDSDDDEDNQRTNADGGGGENTANEAEEEVVRDDDMDIGFRSFQYGQRNTNKRTRIQNQEEALYGVFYESDHHATGRGGGGGTTMTHTHNNTGGSRKRGRTNTTNYTTAPPPMFVPASTSTSTSANITVTDTNLASATAATAPAATNDTTKTNIDNTVGGAIDNISAPMLFVSANNTTSNNNTNNKEEQAAKKSVPENTTTRKDKDKDDDTDTAKEDEEDDDNNKEDNAQIQREQQIADETFLALLQKAKAKNKHHSYRTTAATQSSAAPRTSRTIRGGFGRGLATEDVYGEEATTASLLASSNLPTAFGGTRGGGLGFGPDLQQNPHQDEHDEEDDGTVFKKDPNIATWERHTKGFGSKLLAKMGWKGSGGLGCTRRGFRTDKDPKRNTETDTPTTTAAAATSEKNKDENTEKKKEDTSSSNSVTKERKGISRPVEVVVRPNNMGLGFGSFQEASRLKSNRRIEAEVRGVDYDAQLKQEKDEKKKQDRIKRRQQLAANNQRFDEYQYHDDDDDDDSNSDSEDARASKKNQSSAIPSTDELLSNRLWKARKLNNNSNNKKGRGKRKKNALPEIIPYTELLEWQKKNQNTDTVIIDMRGPDYATKNSKTDQNGVPVVQLGEELLYNLSFLLTTYENKLHSTSVFEQSIRKKNASIQSDIQDIESKSKQLQTRYNKMKKAHEITEQVKSYHRMMTENNRNSSNRRNSNLVDETSHKIKNLVVELENSFTKEDRRQLQFWNVLAPTLLSPIVRMTLDNWYPFTGATGKCDADTDVDGFSQDIGKKNNRIIDSFFEWGSSFDNVSDDDDDSRVLCRSMILNELLPKLKADFESLSSSSTVSSWDPISSTDTALDLYEYLLEKAKIFDDASKKKKRATAATINIDDDDPNQIFPSSNVPDSDDEDNVDMLSSSPSLSLTFEIRKHLIFDAVYPKLQNAIMHWQPAFLSTISSSSLQQQHQQHQTSVDNTNFIMKDPLNLWVLPWLPHLDHPVLLPNLLSDCKRKIKSGLAFMQRKIKSGNTSKDDTDRNDRDYVTACISLLRPWQNVFDEKMIQRMVSEDASSNLISRFARLLSKRRIPFTSTISVSLVQRKNINDDEQYYWHDVGLLFELHGRRIISDIDFLSIMEGAVLSNWAWNLHHHISDGLLAFLSLRNDNNNNERIKAVADTTTNADQTHVFLKTAIVMYQKWKIRILVEPLTVSHQSSEGGSTFSKSFSCNRTVHLLRSDQYVCRMYYSVLRMIQIAHGISSSSSSSTNNNNSNNNIKNDMEELEKLGPSPELLSSTGFRAVASRRLFEQKQQMREDYIRMEGSKSASSSTSFAEKQARIQLAQKRRQHENGVGEPTFRDVVEEIAAESGRLFQPRNGPNSHTIDGKQIFLFGTLPIYFDGDVVFCYDNSKIQSNNSSLNTKWKPTSLDDIVNIASKYTTRN